MKTPDLEKERSEERLSLDEFLNSYNTGLPEAFPRASQALLAEFKKCYPGLFKDGGWTLGQHRKKVMDWLPQRLKEDAQPTTVTS